MMKPWESVFAVYITHDVQLMSTGYFELWPLSIQVFCGCVVACSMQQACIQVSQQTGLPVVSLSAYDRSIENGGVA